MDANRSPGSQLTEPVTEQLYSGPNDSMRIIGPDMFKDFARRHLLMELLITYQWLYFELGTPDEAERFRISAWKDFAGMRLVELTWLFERADRPNEFRRHLTLEQKVKEDHVTWRSWEIPAGDEPGRFFVVADRDILSSFYRDGLPFGTVYNVDLRRPALEAGREAHPASFAGSESLGGRARDYLKSLPGLHRGPVAPFPLRTEMNDPRVLTGTYPPARDLLKLAPSSFRLFACDRDLQDLFTNSEPWWDYDLAAIRYIESFRLPKDPELMDKLLQKKALLEPDAYFDLGDLLRKESKEDAAAEADRKGFDEAYDQVGMSSRVGPKRAADVYSEAGLIIYCDLLEKLGRLTDAADCAQNIYNRYDDHGRLNELFEAHPDTFHDQNAALLEETFPNGLKKVDFSDFKDAPTHGCRINGTDELLEEASLQEGDVIVAFDSYLVENVAQYQYIRGMKRDPHMDLIIWRDSRYMIAHTSAPQRRFNVELKNYTAN